MKNLSAIFIFILFFSSLAFAGSKWTDPSRFSSPIVSAPVSWGQNVYVLTTNGIIYSVQFSDGTSRIFSSLNSASHIPLQKSSNLLFAATDDGKIFSYSTQTSQEVWSYPNSQSSSSQSSDTQDQNLTLRDLYYYDSVLYATFKNRLIAFLATSGEILFERDLKNGACVSADKMGVYVSDADKINSYSKEGRLRWSITTGPVYKSCPTPLGSKLYVPTTRSNLLALNSATGEIDWAYPISGWALSNPILLGSSIFFGTSQGEVLSLHSQTGELNYKISLDGAIWASPISLKAGGRDIAIFGTHNKSIYAIDSQSSEILLNYQVYDWVDHITLANDGKTILATTRDNSLWAIISYPMCTIDYPRSDAVIPQEVTIEGRAFSPSGINSVQLLINSKAYPPKTLTQGNTFEIDVDLTQEPLNIVDIQCIASDSSGLIETDRLGHKTQPILSLGARKLNLSVLHYPSNPSPGEEFTIYIRNSQGFDAQDVLLEYLGKNQTVSSPYKTSAPNEGTYEIVARKSGYYPAQTKFSSSAGVGLIPIVVGVLFILFLISIFTYFAKDRK